MAFSKIQSFLLRELSNNIMKTKNINIFFILLFFQSCVFIRQDDSIDLGNNYRYIQDTPQTIIYHTSEKYEGVGISVIPPIVLSYDFNDKYIIAKSQEVDEMTGSKEGNPLRYWIIDKSLEGSPVEPMDSVTFFQQLEALKINLEL